MKSYLFAIIISILIIAGAAYLAFNSAGVVKYMSVQKTIDSLSIRIDGVNGRNKNLMNGIDSLQKKIPAKIERIAREEYGMSRKNEEVLKVKIEE